MRSLLLGLVISAPLTVNAHEISSDHHVQLIPIPQYSQPYGEASGEVAFEAASAFLASLDNETRSKLLFERDANERGQWSNLPAAMVERAGVSVGELGVEQRDLLFSFLASSLGEEGYRTVSETMAAEAFLSSDPRAERFQWAPENYWVSFYGEPSMSSPWGWQFGGHHLGLNISIHGDVVETMSPSFIGTEPAKFTLNGMEYEAVLDMHRSGYAVYEALDSDQKKIADAGPIPEDVLTGPGKDGYIPEVIGLPVFDMNVSQKELLLNAISEWVSVKPDADALRRMASIRSNINDLYFAWSGSDEVNSPAYMRIQGPELIIELVSTGGNIGSTASGQGHYHTIYRNPRNEYGSSS